jgi:hypothetical protein
MRCNLSLKQDQHYFKLLTSLPMAIFLAGK